MAQHDYVIANQSGAAFRADLNNALAAVVSQNSGAAEPSTTYAYMPWVDTTTGLYKIRNSANSAWVTLYQLDGEWDSIALENGSAGAPSLYFRGSGTDTGVYSPGTDQVAISTGGTQRVNFNAATEVVFNDGGNDVDFRVEGDTKANLFKVDAGLDAVSIDGTLSVSGAISASSSLTASGNLSSSGNLSVSGTSSLTGLVTASAGVNGVLRQATSVASTSGVSIDFTSIPSWVKRISIQFDEVSTSGTDAVIVQIGDSGGIEASGYASCGSFVATLGASTTAGATGIATGFVLFSSGGTGLRTGLLTLEYQASNRWISSHAMSVIDGATAITLQGGGRKALSDTLDRVRVTTFGGTDTFDNGNINIIYEG